MLPSQVVQLQFLTQWQHPVWCGSLLSGTRIQVVAAHYDLQWSRSKCVSKKSVAVEYDDLCIKVKNAND